MLTDLKELGADMTIVDIAGITPLAMADGGELSEGEVYLQRLVDAKNEVTDGHSFYI